MKGPGIDLEKHVALFHCGAFAVILRHEITLHARLDAGVHRAVELTHVFVINRHIFPFDGGHEHLGWRPRWRRGRLARAASGEQEGGGHAEPPDD